MTILRSGSATDIGLVRRINQDQLLVSVGLFAVADGMGGHAAGEVASLTAIEALRAVFASESASPPSAEDLRAAVRRANAAVFERAQSTEDLRGMGTTMTAAALVSEGGEERLAVANVGDSRAYVFAQGELTQLTEDHSVPEELVRLGQLDPEEVAAHPQRHMLTRVLGIMPDVDVDLWEILPFAGDRLVLCSDGLCRELTDDQIAAVLRRLADPTEAAQELVRRARSSGGADNITVVIIDVIDDDGRSEAASDALGEQDEHPSAAQAIPAPAAVDDEAAIPAPAERRRPLTLRLVGFFILLALVLSGAAGAVWYYARQTYYVGLGPVPAGAGSAASAPIIIYRGRPGGLLWFNPTVEERTAYTSSDVPAYSVADLRVGKIESTLSDARSYVTRLVREEATLKPPSTSAATLPSLPPPPAGATTLP